MSVPVLLVATATLWYGAARIPKALAHAGFNVALLAPKNSLAEKSSFVTRVGYLPDNANAEQWVFAFAAMVKATTPRIVIPTDDMAFRLMQMLFYTPPKGLQPALHAQLAGLIRESLGNPGYYPTSVDKTLLPPAAAALGVHVAPFVVVSTLAETAVFVAEHGFPLVVKRSYSTAGDGVAICADRDALENAFADLAPATTNAAEAASRPRMLVQKAIDGRKMFYPAAAWKGQLLAGWGTEKLVANPEPKGPSTVVRRFRDPEARDMSERLIKGFGMSGLLNMEMMIDEQTGRRVLIEINRRVPPGIHSGSRFGIDLCAALLAGIEGRPVSGRTDLDEGETNINVHFPQEWLRDPNSEWVRNYPSDVPWDEPELLEALLGLRHLE